MHPQQPPRLPIPRIFPERRGLGHRYLFVRRGPLKLAHDRADEGRFLLGRNGPRKRRRLTDHLGRGAHGQTARRNVSGDQRVGTDYRPVADGRTGHDEHTPGQPNALTQCDGLISGLIAIQHVEPRTVREDQAVAADARVVADNDGLRGVDIRELQNDGARAEDESGFGQRWAADVDLLADPRILADLDALARDVAHRAHARMAADGNRASLHDREQPDLDMVAKVHVAADHDTAERDLDAAADLVAEECAIRENLEEARHPAE